MNALVVSNFPKDFNESKIRKNLKVRKIDVHDFVQSSKFDPSVVKKVDFIIVMKDMISHSHFDSIKNFAKKFGRKVIPINRKVSSWDFILTSKLLSSIPSMSDMYVKVIEEPETVDVPEQEPIETPMPALIPETIQAVELIEIKPELIQETTMELTNDLKKSVQDRDLKIVMDEYRAMYENHILEEDMVQRLSKYWTNRPLTNASQLRTWINRLGSQSSHPSRNVKEFSKWIRNKPTRRANIDSRKISKINLKKYEHQVDNGLISISRILGTTVDMTVSQETEKNDTSVSSQDTSNEKTDDTSRNERVMAEMLPMIENKANSELIKIYEEEIINFRKRLDDISSQLDSALLRLASEKSVSIPEGFIIFKTKFRKDQVIELPLPKDLTKKDVDKLFSFMMTQIDEEV